MIKLRSFADAVRGIISAIKTERNLRIHFVFAVVVIVLGFIFRITISEWLAALILIGFVISLELVNTAIEKLLDSVAPEFNEKIGRVKDISAGAVLVASVVSVIAGIVIFWKYFAAWISG